SCLPSQLVGQLSGDLLFKPTIDKSDRSQTIATTLVGIQAKDRLQVEALQLSFVHLPKPFYLPIKAEAQLGEILNQQQMALLGTVALKTIKNGLLQFLHAKTVIIQKTAKL